MRDAFDVFRTEFMKFEIRGYINSHDESVKSIWSSAMQFMGEVLGTWWIPWNKATGEDIESPLPNEENLQDLADRLKNAVEHFCRDNQTVDRCNLFWRNGQETSNNQTVGRCNHFWWKTKIGCEHKQYNEYIGLSLIHI